VASINNAQPAINKEPSDKKFGTNKMWYEKVAWAAIAIGLEKSYAFGPASRIGH